MSPEFEIQLIALLTAVSCALPGCFLLLRKMTMMADSITHTVLLGIVIAFFLTGSLSSPLLVFGATAIGMITVWLTEMIKNTKLVSEDASIGIIFPLLFSIAVILISRYAGNVHLDTDSVLMGELAFAPFDRLMVSGKDVGAKSVYLNGFVLFVNISFIAVFFKELKLSAFDHVTAMLAGFSPVLLYYLLMGITSLTAVAAFESAGSVLVVAFMAVPPAAAYLLTDDLKSMLVHAALISAFCAVLGCNIALVLDISIAGSIACIMGITLIFIIIFAPKHGIFNKKLLRLKNKEAFFKKLLLVYIVKQENCQIQKKQIYHYFLRDSKFYINKSIMALQNEHMITIENKWISLTGKGIIYAKKTQYLSEKGII